jgi:hypothetical protein
LVPTLEEEEEQEGRKKRRRRRRREIKLGGVMGGGCCRVSLGRHFVFDDAVAHSPLLLLHTFRYLDEKYQNTKATKIMDTIIQVIYMGMIITLAP